MSTRLGGFSNRTTYVIDLKLYLKSNSTAFVWRGLRSLIIHFPSFLSLLIPSAKDTQLCAGHYFRISY